MEKKLAKLIYSYLRNNKDVGTQFIKEAFIIICDCLNLEANLLVRNDCLLQNDCLALYSDSDNTIKMYTSKINDSIIDELEVLELSDRPPLYNYIYYIKVLLHEVEHLKQYEVIQHNNTAEGLIIKKVIEVDDKFSYYKNYFEYLYNYITYDRKYFKLYRYSPMERLAETKAIKVATDISYLLEDKYTSLIMSCYYYASLISAYKFKHLRDGKKEPTKYYFHSLKTELDWNKLNALSENELMNVKLGLKTNNDFLVDLRDKGFQCYERLRKY